MKSVMLIREYDIFLYMRMGRLVRGHAYAEKLFLQQVWMPLFENFDNLHPEYEIYDWNRKSQFLDFAYMTPFGKLVLNVTAFRPMSKRWIARSSAMR